MKKILTYLTLLITFFCFSSFIAKTANATSPTIANSAKTEQSSTVTTATVNLPSGITSGDLLMIFIRAGGGNSSTFITWPSGWNELIQDASDNSDDVAGIAYRKADGSEGSTVDLTFGSAHAFSAVAMRITGAQDPGTQAPEYAESFTSSPATSIDLPSLSPSGGSNDYLWLAIAGSGGPANDPPTSIPTNYTAELNATQGTTGDKTDLYTAYRQLTASSEDPDTYVSTNGNWMAFTVAVYPAAGAPTQAVFTNSTRTLTAGVCSGSGSSFTVELQDGSGTPTAPTGSTTINVSSNSTGTVTFYSDSSCSSSISGGDITFTTSDTDKTFYMKDTRKSASTWTLTAHKSSGPDTISDGTQTYTLNAGSVTRLVITLPSQTFTDGTGNSGSVDTRTAGSSFTITKISATDDYFNVNTGYSGSKTLAYSGPANAPNSQAPSYTTSVSFTSGQSTTTLTTILYNAETTTITVTDSGSYGYASSSVTVGTGILDHYSVSVTTPQTVGVCFTGTNTVTAQDAYSNNITSDTSTVDMTSTGNSVTFYTSSSCGSSTSQYTLSSGTANIYIKTTKGQLFTVTATKHSSTETGTSGTIQVLSDNYTNAVLNDGPVSYWRLDESTTPFADSIDGNDLGTIIGSVTTQQTGPIITDSPNYAINFGGTGGLKRSGSSIINTNDVWTIEMWVYHNTDSSHEYLYFSTGGSDKPRLDVNRSGYSGDIVASEGPSNVLAYAPLSDNVWHHVVWAHDKTNSIEKIYIDGQDVGTVVNTPNSLVPGGGDAFFGVDNGSAYWDGLIARPAIYDTALTQTSAITHYNAALATGERVKGNLRIKGSVRFK